jgi:long-chain acyl-CoA synthetase
MRPHLASLVDEFRLHSAETAVVAHRGNRRYPTTYGALADLAGRFAAELERRNIVPGDRVILWGENSAEWIAVFFGCLLRGILAVPLDAAGAPDFVARVIRDTAPKLIVADPHLLTTLPAHDTPRLELPTIADHLPAHPLFTISEAVNRHTPFQIVFTSGTTAEPRGIVHTHRNILVSLQPIEHEMAKYRRYERVFHPLRFLHSIPLSHVFGQFMGLWIPALLAAEVHFAEQLEPARITGLIRREHISVLIAVPRMLHLLRVHLLGRFPTLAQQLELTPAPSIWKRWWHFRRIHRALGWKFIAVISGGATLPAELEAFWSRLGFALIQGYGMTETAALVTLNHPFHIKLGTIGKTLPGREVEISADGEILVRGDMLADATWSAGAMHQREGEWLATGDLAEKDVSGELRFLGRKGDVIVTSAGLNIHPADLEAALEAQSGIRTVVVVPCDFASGPEPVAVVLTSSPDLSPTYTDNLLSSRSAAEGSASSIDANLQTAVAAANRTLADYQQIRRILRWPELQFPYTSTGKLLRRQVAAWACATLTGQQQSTASPNQDAVLTLIAEVTGEPIPASPDPDALRLSEDLHLDSLGRVQLQSALEQRFDLELEDDAVTTLETLADLRALIDHHLAPTNAGAPHLDSEMRKLSHQPPASPASQSATEVHLYPHWPWTWPIQALRVVWIELIVRPLVWLLATPRVTCASQLTTSGLQPATPLLIICNHVTLYDGAFVLYALPAKLRRHVAAAMAGEMLLDYRHARNQTNAVANLLAPGAYWLLTALFNVFPLPRARGFRRSFAHAGDAMDHGYSVLIFPEGTRSPDGKLHTFRPGIGLLAQQSRVPILPIAIVGLGEIHAALKNKQDARWFRSGHVEVRIGALIPATTEDADPAALTETLEQAVRTLQSPRTS